MEEVGEDESMDPHDSLDDLELDISLSGRRDSEAQDSLDEESLTTAVTLQRLASASIPCTAKSASAESKI